MLKQLSVMLTAMFFVLASLHASAASRNEGISCVSIGSNVTATYDKADGRTINTRIRVGNSYKGGQCMGRCGGACGNWLPDAWTKDCLDHDICIVDQNGQNGLAADPNCGNEFNHAADDYVFGVWRGCRG